MSATSETSAHTLSAPPVPSAPSAPTASGHLVLIGGALDENPEILGRIVALASASSGNERPRIAIFTTASKAASSVETAADPAQENDAADGSYYASLFARHGAIGVPIPVGVSDTSPYPGATYLACMAENQSVAELVRHSDGVFLGGGDQTHYVRALFRSATDETLPFGARSDTAVLTEIRKVLDRGGVVAGTSAGLTVQQGRHMVSGGSDIHTAWCHGAAAGYELTIADREALSFIPAGGLGLFTEASLDSHFLEWGRPPRAMRLALATGGSWCIGVDEHTALVYDRASRTAEVIGKRGVSILDVTASTHGADPDRGDCVLGTRWSYLVPGDHHDFASNVTTRGERKADLELGDRHSDTQPDLWADDGSRPLLKLAQGLLASENHTASGLSAPDRTPCYRTTLTRDRRTTAFATGGFADLIISISPVQSTN